MSQPIETTQESQYWKIGDKKIDVTIPLFSWQNIEMINLKSMRKEVRLIWGLDSCSSVSLMGSSKSGNVMTEKEEYELISCSKSADNPNGFRKVRVRHQVNGQTALALKLSSGLCYGNNDMSLSISPNELETLLLKAYNEGVYYNEGSANRYILIRSNDFERRMTPNESDKWLVFKSLEPKTLQGLIISVNDAEKRVNSPWREYAEGSDPRLMQILEEIKQG